MAPKSTYDELRTTTDAMKTAAKVLWSSLRNENTGLRSSKSKDLTKDKIERQQKYNGDHSLLPTLDCDQTMRTRRCTRRQNRQLCDQNQSTPTSHQPLIRIPPLIGAARSWRAQLMILGLIALVAAQPSISQQHASSAPILIIDHHHHHHHNQQQQSKAPGSGAANQQQQQQRHLLAHHFQPASLVAAHNKSVNLTHVVVDELTGTIYLSATNWLFQLSARDLKIEQAIRTGPAGGPGAGAMGGAADSNIAARDCAPGDCLTQLAPVSDLDSLATILQHAHNVQDLTSPLPLVATASNGGHKRFYSGATMHTSGGFNASGGTSASGLGATSNGYALLQAQRRPQTQSTQAQTQQVPATTPSSPSAAPGTTSTMTSGPATINSSNNNYNKILTIDYEARQLIVCGSLNQGACRRHQLGNLTNFSELTPVPVASNDEHSSTVALITSSSSKSQQQQQQVKPTSGASNSVIYVAATNSRLGPYREMVPAISARSLDFSSRDRSMQIIERSFTDLARVDISFELRDYYLVNYVHAFQHADYIYFATVQRKSPLRGLEESGYTSRLARLCLGDLSFQSYTEMSLECVGDAHNQLGSSAQSMSEQQQQDSGDINYTSEHQSRSTRGGWTSGRHSTTGTSGATGGRQQAIINYNLLQDAHLMQAGSHLQQQLGLVRGQSSGAVLVATFAQSKDHTTRSSQRSAVCLFPMDKIEQKFNENIDLCYNGTIKSRNMNYIAGSPGDCPRPGSASIGNYCNEPIKLNGSLALTAEPIVSYDNELLTAITSTLAPTSPLNIQTSASTSSQQQQQQGGSSLRQQTSSPRQHQVLVVGTSEGHLKRMVLVSNSANQKIRAIEFDSLPVGVDGNQQQQQQQSDKENDRDKDNKDNGPVSSNQPILADLTLIPRVNPQLQWPMGGQNHSLPAAAVASAANNKWHQYALVATPHKLVKVRVNSCRAQALNAQGNGQRAQATSPAGAGGQQNSSTVDECLACAQVQDPFCGWCSTQAACTMRDECLAASLNQAADNSRASSSHNSYQSQNQVVAGAAGPVHWTPFDSIRCSNYQPISPKNVAIQADSLVVDINVRLSARHLLGGGGAQLASKLAQAAFTCHFDYLSHWNRTELAPLPRPSGATTKAGQARLNLHAGTVAVGCPLPAHAQRPQLAGAADQLKVRLSMRLNSMGQEASDEDRALIERALGMRPPSPASSQQQQQSTSALGRTNSAQEAGLAQTGQTDQQQQQLSDVTSDSASAIGHSGRAHANYHESVERELTLYDCSPHSDCRSCLSAGSFGRRWACSWCPLSSKCTFNSSHPDFGCAASAVASTTPNSNTYSPLQHPGQLLQLDQIRGSHLTPSLDRAQASVLGLTIDKLSQCPRLTTTDAGQSLLNDGLQQQQQQLGDSSLVSSGQASKATGEPVGQKMPSSSLPVSREPAEILIANNVRQSVQVPLSKSIQHYQREKRVIKLECLIDLEGAKARFSARLVDNMNVMCQETLYSYQAEIALQKAQLSVILNDNLVIETSEVILYKCHLFGINPPALTSSVAAASSQHNLHSHHDQQLQQQTALGGGGQPLHHSSASWPPNANDFFNLIQLNAINQQQQQPQRSVQVSGSSQRQSDCSLCLNIDRKFQCSWCSNQCKYTDHCQELAASTCPPPRIDSIHPISGPLEGGTLLTIEGSNLGSNEREIQDKILVGGEPCQLVIYSVSTRIVCKTGPSVVGPQAATVFVGNRAGVTSAFEKFHYKAVHLSDVNPRIGPVSGGTRLFLSGTNLNIGSRVQIFLDDIPCPLDSNFEMTSSQLACITAPNLVVNSMRISRLTLLIDNSTHQLPYPFTYQPDPIITQIEPAESFVSGGRLILITGQHLASPQTTKLMVYHEFKPSIANTTACVRQNDTLVTCLTPAFSRDLLLGALDSSSGSSNQHQQHSDGASQQEEDDDANYRNTDQQQAAAAATAAASQLSALSHDFGGIKLKMALIMDDVKSVRNLDEYYHHLPHYLTYYEDPRLHRLPNQLIEYRDELQIAGENLMMRQLDQDMLITVGAHVCAIKSILSDRVVCEPPARIAPIYDDKRRLVERPLLAMVALIGSNLRYELGYMQYSSSQYTQAGLDTDSSSSSASYGLGASDALFTTNYNGMLVHTSPVASNAHSAAGSLEQANGQGPSSGYLTMGLLSLLGFVVAFAFTLMFAMARFRRAKAKQREYKRIQLQMGSLDINGQPVQASIGFTSGGLFDKIHLPKGKDNNSAYLIQHQQQLFRNANLSSNGHQQQQHQGAMDFVAGGLAGSKTKPFYQFFTNASHGRKQQQQQARLHGPGSFPPSPLTDISSLVGSSPAHGNNHQPQQHILKLNSNGTVISSSTAFGQQQQQYECGPSQMTGALSSLGGSGSSNSSSSGHLLSSGGHNYAAGQAHQLQQQQLDGDLLQQKRSQMGTTGSRNFNWTQEAPSTIVPYAVIEACNLTLTGKNAIKEYV